MDWIRIWIVPNNQVFFSWTTQVEKQLYLHVCPLLSFTFFFCFHFQDHIVLMIFHFRFSSFFQKWWLFYLETLLIIIIILLLLLSFDWSTNSNQLTNQPILPSFHFQSNHQTIDLLIITIIIIIIAQFFFCANEKKIVYHHYPRNQLT